MSFQNKEGTLLQVKWSYWH